MTTTPTAQELEHMIADGKIKLGARPAPVAPTAQEASEAQPCPRFCKCDNCRRYAELLDAMREIGRAPPAASPPESAAPDEICPQCGEYSVAKFSPCPKCGIFGKREPKAESAVAEVEQARRTAEYWKAEQYKANAENATLRSGITSNGCEIVEAPDCDEGGPWVRNVRAEAAEQQLAASEAALREAREDAERYVWLRDEANNYAERAPLSDALRWTNALHGPELDAAIDAARAATKEPT